MSAEARIGLAREQAALVGALTGGGPLPAGFDPRRLRAAASSLARKRGRAVRRAWPCLRREFGDVFDAQFGEYAVKHPLPSRGGALADGRAFVRWLEPRRELPDAVRLQAAAVDLRHRATAEGLVRRSGPAIGIVRLTRPRRLVVSVRLPRLGEWRWSVPFGRRPRSPR